MPMPLRFINKQYMNRVFQPFFGHGELFDTNSQSMLEELASRELNGYRFLSGHYNWIGDTPFVPADVGRSLFENKLARHTWMDIKSTRRENLVLVLGGSLAYGSSASSSSKTWHAILQQALREEWNNPELEIVSAAVGAFTSSQELVALVLCVLDIQPAHIILLNGLNDVTHTWSHGLRPGDPINTSTLLKLWFKRRFQFGVTNRKSEKKYSEFISERLADRNARQIRKDASVGLYCSNIMKISGICQTFDIGVNIFFQPWRDTLLHASGRAEESDFSSDMIAVIEETRKEITSKLSQSLPDIFHDLSPNFSKEEALPLFTDYCHLNDKGQEILAAAIRSRFSRMAQPNVGSGPVNEGLGEP
jgi:lysophospholipase L1-like esterase